MALPDIREKIYSADDLWELAHAPENDSRRFELSEGVLIEMSPASLKHGNLAMDLGHLVTAFVKQHDLGITTAAETGFILFKNPNGKDTVRAPDVGFIAKGRLPDELPDGYAPFAPDLAIEVVSPHDDAEDLELKISQYLKYGTRQVWVFYPKLKRVVVHTRQGARPIDADGVLDGGDVLPGFKLALKDLFGEDDHK